MFICPVANINDWNLEQVDLTVPIDHALRYPGYALKAIRLSRNDGIETAISLPVNSYCKVKIVSDSVWIELEPLVIKDPVLARKFTNGFPSLYIVLPDTSATISDGLITQGELLGNFSSCSIAFQFSDRIERDVSLAADLILAAIADYDHTSWELFCTALRPQADIAFLNANGQRFNQPVPLRFDTGDTVLQFDYNPNTSSLRQLTQNQEGILRVSNPGTEEYTKLVWVNVDASGNALVSNGETRINANTRILLLINLFNWFAPPSRNDFENNYERFTRQNKVKPFVNGPAYFKDVFNELAKAGDPLQTDEGNGRFFLAGYSIKQNDPLVGENETIPKTILEAATKIVNHGGLCYFLPLQFFALNNDAPEFGPTTVMQLAAVIAAVIADIGIIYYLDDANANIAVTLITAGAVLGGMAATVYLAKDIVDSEFVLDKIRGLASSVDHLDFSSGTGKSRKIWALHPATWEDNSYTGPDGFALLDFVKTVVPGVTAYHQKIALVRNAEWIAYCGGIDMTKNRMDDERHMASGPYHDVHARITGPAAREIATTFIERWNSEAPIEDSVSTSDMNSLNAITGVEGGSHIVQVARTIFQAQPGGGDTRKFNYAPTGDRTIIDTLLTAIRSAKEYIYIEDQYFTPTPEYLEALHEAIDNGLKSLIIVLPSSPDQPFSETYRANHIDLLLARNNNPDHPIVRIGYLRRAYTLPSTSAESLTGRMKLGRDLLIADVEIRLGPVSRVPATPFWLSVNGEVMLVKGKTTEAASVDETEIEEPGTDQTFITYQQYFIERGNPTNFFKENQGYLPRKHKKGDPATSVIFNGIYVHAKCMMIDDIFASIGSANLNRRGFHSDTETNIFFVPEALRFDAANPVSLLRKELWSESLNIPFSIGLALLEDPISASKLFDRDSASGNRFIPYRAISTTVKSLLNKLGNITINPDSLSVIGVIKDVLSTLALTGEAINFDELFFHASDPSSFTQDPPEPLP